LVGSQVTYRNARDSTYLSATLTMPMGPGPHQAVILLTVAGTGALVGPLTSAGYAVLEPLRRGFVRVEPLLQATYSILATDVDAAIAYLRSQPDIDGSRLSMIAQADDGPPAILSAVGAPMPLVLLAPPGFPGKEVFRLEQMGTAEREGFQAAELQALERHVNLIADVVLGESSPAQREYRLQVLMAGARTRLPYNAAFPNDDRQIHFFASPLWYDRLAFDPERALSRLSSPVLVLIGMEDPNTPFNAYLAALRRGLSAASVSDATVCLIQGRTRHSFTEPEVEAIVRWLRAGSPRSATLRICLPDPPPD
jgi:pimeloyl-ACP methyl ester carboxylesterase